jgi:hypothetical protein
MVQDNEVQEKTKGKNFLIFEKLKFQKNFKQT